ncbi:GlxA family transcriptional regulator [Pseudogulbenkiania subflava]|uniref:Transcriptional regulator, AraC family with amidase-like domain n=1 Tax=Pseudogulbenkiania subflava DSM 22618 TaxID=1123014 RepID=A0A1Y6BB01_9NEIS|nr:GlxA family transcriptional regulator [Pseudogulbenkiania subflava]SME94756.1 transcriptional regulator, AraC family with amidase-like domain [Pseudogulbenkiania subflava DSM 22618]
MSAPCPTPPTAAPEDIHFVLLPEFSMLGLLSAIEPLRVANRFHPALYRWHLLSLDGGAVSASNGMSLAAEGACAGVGEVRTLFVVAGFNPLAHATPALTAWLRQLDRQGATLGGIDTGSFVLAEAGMFRHEKLTLHWEAIAAFRERYPALNVTQELFEIDGARISSAGGTASIDLMLELIGRRHGAELAMQVSEQFVLGRIRAKSDHQRLQIAVRYGVHNRKLVNAIGAMERHLETPLTADELAETVGVTRRQLERLFRAQFDDTPSAFYLKLRLERARELLRQTGMNVMEIGVACGFESATYFARAYRQRYGVTPSHDRHEENAARAAP